MNFTRRKNGLKMVNISVKFAIGQDELISALVLMFDDEYSGLHDYSRGGVMKFIRNRIYEKGVEGFGYLEEAVTGDYDELRGKADYKARSLFPEAFK